MKYTIWENKYGEAAITVYDDGKAVYSVTFSNAEQREKFIKRNNFNKA